MDSLHSLADLTLDDSTPTPSCLLISEEAQDLILHHVGISTGPHCARSTRYAFAVVHRNWIVSGNRMLYRKPFDDDIHWTYEKGKNFLETVMKRGGLAAAVRDLGGITDAVHSMNNDVAGKSTGERGSKKYRKQMLGEWLYQVIESCPSVKRMELSLVSSDFIKKLSVALETHADLEEVRIISSVMYKVTPALYSQWTTACRTPSIKEVTLDDFSNDSTVTFTILPLF